MDHGAAQVGQQCQGDPGDGLLGGGKGDGHGVDAQPARQGHDNLEKGEGTGNQRHAAAGHVGLTQSVGHRHGEGVHGQPHAKENTIDKKQSIVAHGAPPDGIIRAAP